MFKRLTVEPDTIFALASGQAPAAIAIVRVSGARAHEAAIVVSGHLPPVRRASLRQLIDPVAGGPIDQALVLRFDAPLSVTGENIVEFHCHGGRAVVDALLKVLARLEGFRVAEPGEFTRRALANGRIDLTEAEGLADLLAAETELQRRSAVARAGGALRARLDEWRNRLLELSARSEVAIDYADEEDGSPAGSLSPELSRLASEMAELLDAPAVEQLRDGVRVVVAGPTNAGKSSLINALSQSDRAIVTAIPGTTRDVIEVPLAIDGLPFVLVDTAGLRDSHDEVETIGIERARAQVEQADILLWLGEAGDVPKGANVILVRAKADLPISIRGMRDIETSSVSGQGIADLCALLVATAREMLPKGDELSLDRRQRHLVHEACAAIGRGANLDDAVLVAEELRSARHALDRISGRSGVEDLLDALFGRFCLGK